jgi:hypothetical protein
MWDTFEADVGDAQPRQNVETEPLVVLDRSVCRRETALQDRPQAPHRGSVVPSNPLGDRHRLRFRPLAERVNRALLSMRRALTSFRRAGPQDHRSSCGTVTTMFVSDVTPSRSLQLTTIV